MHEFDWLKPNTIIISLIVLVYTPELQKAFNLPQGKIFKICKRSSKCCKVGLYQLTIKINHYFSGRMISGKDHHLLIFGYMLVFWAHYVVC